MPQIVTSLADIPPLAVYLARVGAEPRSLRTAVVKEHHGKYWRDVATISVNPEFGSIKVWHRDGDIARFSPTKQEAEEIAEAFKQYAFPASKRVLHYTLPLELRTVDPENIFHFKDRDGTLIMLVVRSERKDTGDKVYRAWTFFDDDLWRCAEPDGKLPLWGLEHLDGNSTVFIHEGPKAARAMHRLIHPHTDAEHDALRNHPLRDELQHCAHLGWHGGALNPLRTDWSVLERAGIKHVYLVADNDTPGIEAIPVIAEQLRGMKVYGFRFPVSFPPSFDMADEWPMKLFEEQPDKTFRYVGPRFECMLSPATWATDKIMVDKKTKPVIVLRDGFAHQWRWCGEQDVFVNLDRPTMCYAPSIFDGMVAPFSDSPTTSALVKKMWKSQAYRMVYRPDEPHRIITEEGAPVAVNMFCPTGIKPEAGNSQPWEDFLDYLFVNQNERHEVKRWCATLIARPDIRMMYALLLISETQGMGKTTLGEHILSPLVGMHNTSFASETQIVESQFNSWLVKKRLIVVGEIYSGKSWKAYNNLKSYITDRTLDVNEKFMRPYTIANWAHFVCCSNSMRALKIEETDRRWFYPELSESPWPRERFVAFYNWLSSGGLNIVKHWAEQFGDYVAVGEHAPMTERKRELINESIPEAFKLLMGWCEAHGDHEMIVSDRMIKSWLDNEKAETKFFSALELRKVLQKRGWRSPGFQIHIDGVMQYAMISPKLIPQWEGLNGASDKDRRTWVRERIKPMVDAADRSL